MPVTRLAVVPLLLVLVGLSCAAPLPDPALAPQADAAGLPAAAADASSAMPMSPARDAGVQPPLDAGRAVALDALALASRDMPAPSQGDALPRDLPSGEAPASVSTPPRAPADPSRGLRVLYVGNSLLYWGPIWQIVGRMIGGVLPYTSDALVRSATPLYRFVADGSVQRKIRSGTYTHVVLEPFGEENDGGARTVATIAAEATAIGARVVLYMTCMGQMEPPTMDSERRRQHLDTWYRTVAAQVNGWVVPAAHACADAKRADPLLPVRAQNRDVGNVHPSPWGFYLISAAFYGVLAQRSPLGVASRTVQPFPPGPEAPLLFDVDDRQAAWLRAVAWSALARFAAKGAGVGVGWSASTTEASPLDLAQPAHAELSRDEQATRHLREHLRVVDLWLGSVSVPKYARVRGDYCKEARQLLDNFAAEHTSTSAAPLARERRARLDQEPPCL